MKKMACVFALATGTGLALGVTAQQAALADPGLTPAMNGLKIAVIPPSSVAADAPVAFDVNFRGGRVRSVELFVDGARVAREAINTVDTHGVIHFTLPEGFLTEGPHEIMLQAIDKDGNSASSTTRIRVAPGDTDALAHFVTPKRSAEIRDIAPIEVKIDPSLKDPYVNFYIDDKFLLLRNYAPYNLNLDTTNYTNGLHTIKIEILDGNLASIKTLTMQVNVNNPGGKTVLQDPTHAPAAKTTNPTTADADVIRSAAESAEPTGADIVGADTLRHQDVAPRVSFSMRSTASYGLLLNRPSADRPHTLTPVVMSPALVFNPMTVPFERPSFSIARSIDAAPPTSYALSPEMTRVLAPRAVGASAIGVGPNMAPRFVTSRVPQFSPGALATPSDIAALSSAAIDNSLLSRVALRPHHSGNIALRPRMEFGAPVEVAPAHVTVVAFHPAARASRPMTAHHGRTFDVAFDNTKIAFDVQPRVEHGMPLAPFRAIFEHSGGSVAWFDKSRTVRATNSTREVEFQIGSQTATVNNHKVQMAARPYTENGRAIVPLSFVRDAMDVKITYDAATGHLMIQSNK